MEQTLMRFLAIHQLSLKKLRAQLLRMGLAPPVLQVANRLYQDQLANQRAIAVRATWYERQIEHVLSSQNVEFQTERDILAADPDARCTPDIWFPEPVTIRVDDRMHQIHWLDAKSMLGTPVFKMQLSSLKKQATKYHEKFGPGALVFQYGFDTDLARHLPGTLLLDYLPSDPMLDDAV